MSGRVRLRLSCDTVCVLALAALVVSPALAASAQFTDVTVAAGVDVTHQIIGVYDHADYTGGGAVGDFDGDGWQDLFVISGGAGATPDHLFINNRDGTFSERSVQSGLKRFHLGKGAAVADYDGDGDLDLFVTSAGDFLRTGPGHHRLYRNDGKGNFTNVAWEAGVAFSTPANEEEDGFGSTFGDYDLDGDLDLFVAGFEEGNVGSRLYRNDGDGTFTDITAAINLFGGTPIDLHVFAPRFIDMDGDRYPELLLASDFGTSRYFRNNGNGTFTDITQASGTGLDENGMGQTVGDFNGDGLPDWYVTSIYWPVQMWTGNKLYVNQGAHTYTESAGALGVDDGGYGWGAVAVDFNHDRLLDIAETNGNSQFAVSEFAGEPSYLWIQQNNGTFVEQAATAGMVHTERGRGMLNFDYDNDGDQDVVIFTYAGRVSLFRNDVSGSDAHWLRVFLDTSGEPGLAPNGIGAKVAVTAGGTTQTRWITAGDNFLSHGELSAHFGLKNSSTVSSLVVSWPDGTTTTLSNLSADRTLTVVAGQRETTCTNGTDDDNDGLTDCDDTDCCGLTGCQNGEGVCCTAAPECDDGAFCNGVEQCVDDLCVGGGEPCAGQQCDEGGDVCVQCASDAACDDGVHCNGVESCSAGVCVAGSDPCPGRQCEEFREICVDCVDHAECPDDGLWCNGSEICNQLGECDHQFQNCPGLGCDESLDQCVGTIALQPKAGQPFHELTANDRVRFEAGRDAFRAALAAGGGLGPAYSANSCAACHAPGGGAANGPSATWFGEDDLAGGVTRLPGGPLLQPLGVAPGCEELLPAQADVLSVRSSGALAGIGALQAIGDTFIQGRAITPPAGTSGMPAYTRIADDPGEVGVGRFGSRGSGITVLGSVAREARDQLGLTNHWYPEEIAPNDDSVLLAQCDAVNDPEDAVDVNRRGTVDAIASYLRLLAPPPQTPKIGMAGEALFNTFGCGDCHVKLQFTLSDPRYELALGGRVVFPYSDLLLHDMGANGDPFPEGLAQPGEVLTGPLWGLRSRETLWHDGRFAGGSLDSRVLAAIGAHDTPGGEGVAAAQAFAAAPQADRDAVLAFLHSLGRPEFDHDGDGDVDVQDRVTFDACFTGPGAFYTADDPCSISDVDADGDVDAEDQALFAIAADSPAGAVPDGASIAGPPLTLGRLPGSQVRLTWSASCSSGDVDYAVYEGTLGSFDSHAPAACSTGGATTADVLPAAGSAYFLVVPSTRFREGSYGRDGDGSERSAATNACHARAPGACQP